MNRDNGYTPEEDRYMLWLCRETWDSVSGDRMKRRMDRDEEFGFDYFLLSKTEQEVDRRVNVLLREIQRFSDPDYKGRKSRGKKKDEEKKEDGGGREGRRRTRGRKREGM